MTILPVLIIGGALLFAAMNRPKKSAPGTNPPGTIAPSFETEYYGPAGSFENEIMGRSAPLPFAQDPDSGLSYQYLVTTYPVGLIPSPNLRPVVTDERLSPVMVTDNGIDFLRSVSAAPTYFDSLTGETVIESTVGETPVYLRFMGLPIDGMASSDPNALPLTLWAYNLIAKKIPAGGDGRFTLAN